MEIDIKTVIQTMSPKSVLDFDVRGGEILRVFADENVSAKYIGYNPLEENQYNCQAIISNTKSWDRCEVKQSVFNHMDVSRTIDMIMTSANVRDNIYQHMLNSWELLSPRGCLCIYVNNLNNEYANILQDLMKCKYDLRRSARTGNLLTWTKINKIDTLKPYPPITLRANTYSTDNISLYKRAMPLFVRTLPNKVTYLCRKYDNVALELASVYNGEMQIKVDNVTSENFSAVLKKVCSGRCRLTTYEDSYNDARNKMSKQFTGPDERFIESGINTPVFEAIMEYVLRRDLTRDAVPLAEPERVCIKPVTETVIKILTRIWTKTVFICFTHWEFDKSLLDKHTSHRVIAINTQNLGKLKLNKLMANYGYPTDKLFI